MCSRRGVHDGPCSVHCTRQVSCMPGCTACFCWLCLSLTRAPAPAPALPQQEWAKNVTSGKLSKGDKLGAVDHTKVRHVPLDLAWPSMQLLPALTVCLHICAASLLFRLPSLRDAALAGLDNRAIARPNEAHTHCPSSFLQVTYAPFRRSFYTEVPELARMTEEEVTALRKELDGIKVCGPPLGGHFSAEIIAFF